MMLVEGGEEGPWSSFVQRSNFGYFDDGERWRGADVKSRNRWLLLDEIVLQNYYLHRHQPQRDPCPPSCTCSKGSRGFLRILEEACIYPSKCSNRRGLTRIDEEGRRYGESRAMSLETSPLGRP